MKRISCFLILNLYFFIAAGTVFAQQKWENVDSLFPPLPSNFHVYRSTDSLDGKPFIAYYATAKLKDRSLGFTADTSKGRRLTPLKFYEKNNQPLLVVNCTFFSYETNRSLNAVIKDGELVAFNTHSIPMKGKDTFQYRHPLGSVIGIDKKRNADVAWLYTDSSQLVSYAMQRPVQAYKDSSKLFLTNYISKKMISLPSETGARHGDDYDMENENRSRWWPCIGSKW